MFLSSEIKVGKGSNGQIETKQATFGNRTRIITDKGKVFTESEFKEYCSNKEFRI